MWSSTRSAPTRLMCSKSWVTRILIGMDLILCGSGWERTVGLSAQPSAFLSSSAIRVQYLSVSSTLGPSTMTRHMFWVPE